MGTGEVPTSRPSQAVGAPADPVAESAAAHAPGGAERRRFERAPFPARVVVAWRDGAGACETHAVVDMSLGGFRLHADRDVPIGRVGRAVHILPDRTAVDLDVLVVWSVHKGTGGCEFGVRFVGD